MQLKCPHCSNVFESTGYQIHFCPSCGRKFELPTITEAPVTPEPGAPEHDTTPGGFPPPPPGPGASTGEPIPRPTPWERRGELGLVSAYWQTWKEIVLSPEKFWDSAPPNGSLWDALSFAWVTTAVTTVLSLPLTFLQMAGNRAAMEELLSKMKLSPEVYQTLIDVFTGGTFAVGYTAAVLALYPVSFIIMCGILHLFCLLFGCSRNGFVATARAIGYANAPLLFSWIPCANVVAAVYAIVLQVWGVAKLQRSTYTRAVLAFLTPFVIVCCCACAGVFAIFSAIAGSQ